MKYYAYGMRLREYGIGCQPMGVVKVEYTDKQKTGYWSIIYYTEKLCDKDVFNYDLDYLGEEN